MVVDDTLRIGVTGLARAGKTAFLTSAAANLLAWGAGRAALPALGPAGRVGVSIAPAGASALPRFDVARHRAALAADPPDWPARTNAASLMALDFVIPRQSFGVSLPSHRLRVELLDYPGEWLLDLPLLQMSFHNWSTPTLARLYNLRGAAAAVARDFLAFSAGLPAGAAADEALVAAGHGLYRTMLTRLRDEQHLALLQPGRFLMPAPGDAPPWIAFFPHSGTGNLTALLSERYDAYVAAAREDLAEPMFGNLDRIVVLADLLSALHAGAAAFRDTQAALGAVSAALRWRATWLDSVRALGHGRWPPRAITRVAYAATKADHVASRQRGNLAALMRDLVRDPAEPLLGADVPAGHFAIAAVRCTEDVVWQLDGHPVSAVRGRRIGDAAPGRSYPGEVPDRVPDASFWQHPFLDLPVFEPLRLPDQGRGGVPSVALDELLAFILADVL